MTPHPQTTPARLSVGDAAPTLTVHRADGSPVELATFWQDAPAVLVFLRHLGCTFCREHVAQLRQDAAEFERYGATILLLSVGNPEDTHAFCESREISAPFVCLSDSEKRSYAAYGLSRGGASELFAPHIWGRGLRATLHGHLVGLPKGDPFQMPGVFIVDTSGVVRYAHVHKDASDNPPNEELLNVLKNRA